MSQPYRQPSFKEQMGFAPDPNRLEHVRSGNHRLTRLYTNGGHEVDTSQPGLPTYHRRIGNPLPLVLLGIGTHILLLGLILVGARGLKQLNVSVMTGLPLGGAGLFIACCFAFAEGNTFAATLGGCFGGLIAGLSIVYLPWSGVQAAYIAAAGGELLPGVVSLYSAVSLLFFCAMIPVFFIYMASFKTAAPISGGALQIIIALILLGVDYYQFGSKGGPQIGLEKGAGALFIIVGVVLWYLAAAIMLNEENIPVPVLPLPRSDDY